MCIACNPICGHCKPPKKKAIFCPNCGQYNLFDIIVQYPPVERHCSACGADLTVLTTPPVVRCKNTGWLCANPCGFSERPPESCPPRICRSNTPPPVCEAIA